MEGKKEIDPNLKILMNLTLAVILGVMILSFFSFRNVSAQPSNQVNYTVSSASQGLSVTQLDYSPFPANPGEYFDLWISAQYFGSQNAPSAIFQLQPTFPFSLDPNQSSNQTIVLVPGQNILVHYKVKVDPNAVTGDNELDLLYTTDSSGNVWGLKKLDISVADSQTDFATVLQPSTGTSGYSFSVVNTGENTANSVIVQIPDQPDFRVAGTNGQVVGNLAAGDYTVVNFDIIPSYSRTFNGSSGSSGNAASGNSGSAAAAGAGNMARNLTVEIDYTDSIGVRRNVFDTVELNPSLSAGAANLTAFASSGSAGFALRRNTGSSSSGSIFTNIWFWLFVAAIAGGFIFYYKKHPEEVKNLFKKNSQRSDKKGSATPDWVIAERRKK